MTWITLPPPNATAAAVTASKNIVNFIVAVVAHTLAVINMCILFACDCRVIFVILINNELISLSSEDQEMIIFELSNMQQF